MNIDINLKIFSFNWKVSINKQWIQLGIITTVILISFIVSYWGAGYFRLFLLSLAGLVVILALIQQLNLGFIFIFLGGMYFSYSLEYYEKQFGGINVVVLLIGLLLFLWFFDMLVVKREFRIIKSRVILSAFVFLVVSVIAFGVGQIHWYVFARQAPFNAQFGGFIIFAFSIGALLLSAHLIRDLQWLKIIVWIFIGLGFLYICIRVLRIFSLGIILHPSFSGSMFWTWLVVLSFGQAIFNTQLRPIVRWLLVGIVLLTLYIAIGRNYEWKSGWMPPLVSVAIILGIRFKKVPRFTLPIGLIFAIYIFRVLTSYLIASDDYSWITRVEAWKIILNISRVSPLLGTGFSNYYWYTPKFPIFGWRVNFNSHNQYIDLIAQTGFLGLLCFFWIFFEVGRLSLQLSRKLPDGFARAYSYSVFAGTIGTLVAGYLGDWVLPFVYNVSMGGFRVSILPWLFFGGLISIEQMILRNDKQVEN